MRRLDSPPGEAVTAREEDDRVREWVEVELAVGDET